MPTKLGGFGLDNTGGRFALYDKYNQGPSIADLKARIGGLSGAQGNAVVSTTIIEPPDDRYYPGYTITQADGDTRTVGPRLKDLNIPFSLYGLPIPLTFGVRRLYGNLIWAVPLRENSTKKKKGGGGKGGGGSKSKTETFEYFATFACAFGYSGTPNSPKRDILRMWADGSLIYDRRSSGAVKIEGLNFTFYPGSETQTADPTIEFYQGEGNVPSYRGLMYVVVNDLAVAQFGDRPPAISIEVGDVTAPSKSVTNIYPDLVEGSRNQDDILVDFSRYQAYTMDDSTNIVRTYDLLNRTVISAVEINPSPGVGWDSNSGPMTYDNLSTGNTGYSTLLSSPCYIPWLNAIVTHCDGTGAEPFFLFDPISGSVLNWIGAEGAVTNAAYPSNNGWNPLIEDYPYFKGLIPAGGYFVPQFVYNLYGLDTYIFFQCTIYNCFVVFHIDGVTNIMDMLYINNSVEYDEMVQGPQVEGYSDVFLVDGNIIYRARITVGARRINLTDDNESYNFEITTWKDMGAGINNFFWYTPEQCYVVIMDDGTWFKYDLDGVETDTGSIASVPPAHILHKHLNDYASGGIIAWDAGTAVNEFSFAFGTLTTYAGQGNGYAAGGGYVNSIAKAIVGIGGSGSGSNGTGQTESMADAVSILYYDRMDSARMLLTDFLYALCIEAGYDPSEIYFSPNITDTIDGAMITNITTLRSVIDPISALYRIDVVESGGVIKFLRKAEGDTASDFTVADGETLLESPDNPEGKTFEVRREEEIGVPERLNLRYLDKDLSYQWSMQFTTRSRHIETNQSETQLTYEIPIIMNATEAKQLTYRFLWTSWNSRVSFAFRLDPSFLRVEPGDVATVTVESLTYTVKCVQVTYNNDFTTSIVGRSFLSDEAITVEADTGEGYPQTIPLTVKASSYFIDIPLLVATHDLNYASQFGTYTYLGPVIPTTAWTGGNFLVSYDSLNYEVESANDVEGFVGVVPVVATVPDNITETDTENALIVYTREGDNTLLVSCTYDEMLTGSNVAVYGAEGRWEVIQYQTVTTNADGSFSLTNLLRGQRGTDYAVDFHKPGDAFIFLSDAFINLLTFPFADIDSQIRHKGVTFNSDDSVIVPKLATVTGYSALPWVPGNVQIERDRTALTGDITITWDRRSRTNGTLRSDGEFAELGTTEENSYKVTIRRWTHKDYAWSGSNWDEVTDTTNDEVEFIVTDATELVLTAAEIRTAELYEYAVPDTPASFGTTFTQTAGSAIAANATANLQIVDLGFGSFVAFKHLEIMIQQKTNVPNSSGYGPGRWQTVIIKDL